MVMTEKKVDDVLTLDLGVDGTLVKLLDSDLDMRSSLLVGKDGSLKWAANYDKEQQLDGYHIEWDEDEKLKSITSFCHGKQEGKSYLFEKGEVIRVAEYSGGELVSSKDDCLVLAKARTKEIPNIVNSVLKPYAKTLKEIKRESRVNGEGKMSGTVVNDQAVKAGVSLKKPVDTKTLQGMVASRVLDDFLNS